MGYSVMAYSAQPASVAPAGEAWRSYPDRASLFDADGSHAAAPGNPCCIFSPNQIYCAAGTYLTALTMLETIWAGVSCVGNSYQPVGEAALLQSVAHQTITQGNWSWPEAGPHPCSVTQCLY